MRQVLQISVFIFSEQAGPAEFEIPNLTFSSPSSFREHYGIDTVSTRSHASFLAFWCALSALGAFWCAWSAPVKLPAFRILLSQLIQTTGVGAIMPILPIFSRELGLGGTEIGLLLSAAACARLFGNAPFGRLSVPPQLSYMLPFRLGVGMGRAALRAGNGPYMVDLTW
eukprot:g17934.t1